VQSGNSVSIFLIAPRKGQYDLTCADHDWDGMIGSITVD
jgi:plastocyanin